jgi:hypothetical protein
MGRTRVRWLGGVVGACSHGVTGEGRTGGVLGDDGLWARGAGVRAAERRGMRGTDIRDRMGMRAC